MADSRERRERQVRDIHRMPVVDFLVIGAMKCGTTSLHHYLTSHPQLALPPEKEVDFFFGDGPGGAGNHWRGIRWYDDRFPVDAPVRGDVSPGYTSPDHPDVADRAVRLVPDARLIYLVRDPLERAVSQFRHHRRDRTEGRDLAEALLDPHSHYIRRSRYAACLRPFVDRFPASHIAVVDQDDLLHHTASTVAWICRFLGVEPRVPTGVLSRRLNRSVRTSPVVPHDVATEFRSMVAADTAEFEAMRSQVETMPRAAQLTY